MALELSDVGRIARLARLELPADQLPRVQAELNGLFDLIETLQNVDTQGVEPLAHPLSLLAPVALRLRDDVVTETASAHERAARQHSAPAVQDGLYLVPRVIE